MNRGYSAIGLVNPKTPANVGSVLRAAGCYDVSMVGITGRRMSQIRLGRCPTDTNKIYRTTPVMWWDEIIIPHDCVPVAVDLLDDAQSLVEYKHPERAIYIFGPEDGTLGAKITNLCRDKVYVPTRFCMNLAATVNVVLYDRMAKQK